MTNKEEQQAIKITKSLISLIQSKGNVAHLYEIISVGRRGKPIKRKIEQGEPLIFRNTFTDTLGILTKQDESPEVFNKHLDKILIEVKKQINWLAELHDKETSPMEKSKLTSNIEHIKGKGQEFQNENRLAEFIFETHKQNRKNIGVGNRTLYILKEKKNLILHFANVLCNLMISFPIKKPTEKENENGKDEATSELLQVESNQINIKPEVVIKLYNCLKEYFAESDKLKLKRLLGGESIEGRIAFLFNQNRLVEVFRRLKYNGYISDNPTQIKNWLCRWFRFKNESAIKIKNLNAPTVWKLLTSHTENNGEPRKQQRICVEVWFPYKSRKQLREEKERERLNR